MPAFFNSATSHPFEPKCAMGAPPFFHPLVFMMYMRAKREEEHLANHVCLHILCHAFSLFCFWLFHGRADAIVGKYSVRFGHLERRNAAGHAAKSNAKLAVTFFQGQAEPAQRIHSFVYADGDLCFFPFKKNAIINASTVKPVATKKASLIPSTVDRCCTSPYNS